MSVAQILENVLKDDLAGLNATHDIYNKIATYGAMSSHDEGKYDIFKEIMGLAIELAADAQRLTNTKDKADDLIGAANALEAKLSPNAKRVILSTLALTQAYTLVEIALDVYLGIGIFQDIPQDVTEHGRVTGWANRLNHNANFRLYQLIQSADALVGRTGAVEDLLSHDNPTIELRGLGLITAQLNAFLNSPTIQYFVKGEPLEEAPATPAQVGAQLEATLSETAVMVAESDLTLADETPNVDAALPVLEHVDEESEVTTKIVTADLATDLRLALDAKAQNLQMPLSTAERIVADLAAIEGLDHNKTALQEVNELLDDDAQLKRWVLNMPEANIVGYGSKAIASIIHEAFDRVAQQSRAAE
ncbi:hypothetical protein GC177_03030 [bacterium]|nr:hypothetical protein [bacterium]